MCVCVCVCVCARARASVRHLGYPTRVIITTNSFDHSMDLLHLVFLKIPQKNYLSNRFRLPTCKITNVYQIATHTKQMPSWIFSKREPATSIEVTENLFRLLRTLLYAVRTRMECMDKGKYFRDLRILTDNKKTFSLKMRNGNTLTHISAMLELSESTQLVKSKGSVPLGIFSA